MWAHEPGVQLVRRVLIAHLRAFAAARNGQVAAAAAAALGVKPSASAAASASSALAAPSLVARLHVHSFASWWCPGTSLLVRCEDEFFTVH